MFSIFNGSGRLRREADAARDRLEWSRAAATYRRYLDRRPRDGAIWVQLGNCLKEARAFGDAKTAYETALSLMGDDADLYLQKGHLAKIQGQLPEAIAAYRKAAALDPDRDDARKELKAMGQPAGFGHLVNPARDRQLNKDEAAADPRRVAASAAALDALCAKLHPGEGDGLSAPMPQVLHFVYGFNSKSDLPYYGAMAIRSALHFNPGWRAYYYTMNEPEGPNWDTVKDRVTLVLIDDFDYFGNARLYHYAHKADIVRMLVLNRMGGAYLDIDTITQRSFEDLRKFDFVMGVQAAGSNSSSGLCNAIMFGKPGAAFSTRWLAEYDYFRSKGRDDLWDYHSVKLPVHLAAKFPHEIKVLDYRAFFYPLWTSIEKAMFSDVSAIYADDLAPAYCFHLWNGATGPWLDEIDLEFVRTSPSIYAQIAREVEGVPQVKDASMIRSASGEETAAAKPMRAAQ